MTSPPDGPDQPSHGREYPPLENSPPLPDAYAPVDYPPDVGQPPSGYPGQFGYSPPGYPDAGYPPPLPGSAYQGYPAAYPYGYDPYRPAGTNGKAIAAMVTSLLSLVCCQLPGVIGIVLGVIALREIKRTGQDGHGMALAGVIVGAVAVTFGVFVLVLILAFGDLSTTSSF